MTTDATYGQEPERFSLGYTELVPWDLSYRPIRNLYLDKVGVFGSSRAVAMDKMTEDTLIRRLANGVDQEDEEGGGAGEAGPFGESVGESVATGGGSSRRAKIDTRRPLEPDNWALRLHQTEGKKNLSTWAQRLIADNSNPSSKMECRGTMVIDQGDSQIWAFLNDLFQCADMKTPVASKELAFNGAGFLGLLYPDFAKSGAQMTRAALALAVHRNKGHATDGGSVGALSHIVTFEQPKADVATEGGGAARPPGPGETVTRVEPEPRKATSQPSKKDELLLRADAGICFGPGKIGRWLDEPDGNPNKGAEADERRLVKLFLHDPAPPDDKLDTAKDGNSNHEVLPKSLGKKVIHGVVRIPKLGGGDCNHYDDSYHHPPPENGDGSGGGASGAIEYGGYSDTGAEPPSTTHNADELLYIDDNGNSVFPGDPVDENRNLIVEPSAQAAALGTQQVQSGFAPAASPAFTQRFNVHEYSATAHTVGTVKKTKPKVYRGVIVGVDLRISAAIPSGKEIELEVMVIPNPVAGTPIARNSSSIKLNDATPTGEWLRFTRGFRVNTAEETPLLILLIRRNDLAIAATGVELWRDLTTVTYER